MNYLSKDGLAHLLSLIKDGSMVVGKANQTKLSLEIKTSDKTYTFNGSEAISIDLTPKEEEKMKVGVFSFNNHVGSMRVGDFTFL